MGGHSFILGIDRLWSQCLLGERLCECIMDYVIFNQGVGACGKTTSAIAIVSNQLLYRDLMPLIVSSYKQSR